MLLQRLRALLRLPCMLLPTMQMRAVVLAVHVAVAQSAVAQLNGGGGGGANVPNSSCLMYAGLTNDFNVALVDA